MDRYEVIIRDKAVGNRWSMMFEADDFGHAEEQAIDAIKSDILANREEIIQNCKGLCINGYLLS